MRRAVGGSDLRPGARKATEGAGHADARGVPIGAIPNRTAPAAPRRRGSIAVDVSCGNQGLFSNNHPGLGEGDTLRTDRTRVGILQNKARPRSSVKVTSSVAPASTVSVAAGPDPDTNNRTPPVPDPRCFVFW